MNSIQNASHLAALADMATAQIALKRQKLGEASALLRRLLGQMRERESVSGAA